MPRRRFDMSLRTATALTALLAASLSTGCGQSTLAAHGDAERGKIVILRGACGSCHRIPGISLADGLAGPPLAGFGGRTVIAGFLPNTPDNLTRWLLDPQGVAPGSAMPAAVLNARDARDAAAYLETLRKAA